VKLFRFRLSQALLSLTILGCSYFDEAAGQNGNTSLRALVSAADQSGRPVGGATVFEGKRQLGVTNSAGVLELSISGQPGSTHSLDVKCPGGFASPERGLEIKVAQLASSSPTPRFVTRCTALVHHVVLGIRTENGPNLPVLYLGKELTRTDTTGVAHLSLTLPPGETASVVLDTSSVPGLTPENPALVFKASDTDELLLLEQRFIAPKKHMVAVKPNRPQPL
jgi:hypothetical protein